LWDDDTNLCYDYWLDQGVGLILNNIVAVLISIVNIIIRKVNMTLIDVIGYNTETEKVQMIMKSIFWTSLVNTGIILLLTNANFEYSVLKMIPIYN